jgi:hypothetical protein
MKGTALAAVALALALPVCAAADPPGAGIVHVPVTPGETQIGSFAL